MGISGEAINGQQGAEAARVKLVWTCGPLGESAIAGASGNVSSYDGDYDLPDLEDLGFTAVDSPSIYGQDLSLEELAAAGMHLVGEGRHHGVSGDGYHNPFGSGARHH